MLIHGASDIVRLAAPVAVVFALGLAISCGASRARVLQAPSTPVATAPVPAAPVPVAPVPAAAKAPSVASSTPTPAPASTLTPTPAPTLAPAPSPVPVPERTRAFRAALERSSWPSNLHAELEVIAFCESSLEPTRIGDGGLAYGWLQVRIDYHPALAAAYDLLHGPSNLEAGWQIYRSAGDSFQPWSCWAGR